MCAAVAMIAILIIGSPTLPTIPPVEEYGTVKNASAIAVPIVSHFQPIFTHKTMPNMKSIFDSVMAGIGAIRIPLPIAASAVQAVYSEICVV